MIKGFRQGQILQLIRTRAIGTQDELARALKEVGIDTTQVTLSRDMRDLGLVKTSDGYRELARDNRNQQFAALASEFVQDIRQAQNQVVLKTAPGHANSVAVVLDDEGWAEVVGTLAGDDTVLVICPDPPTAAAFRTRLLGMLE